MMLIKKNDFNERQVHLAIERIARYEQGTLELGHLVNDLTAIAYALKDLASDDRNELLSEIGALEDVYASALNREQPPDASDKGRIADVLDVLKHMLGQGESKAA